MDTVIGGVSARKSGLSNGDAKHLMNQGIDTVKNYKGFSKTAKYYFSQTKEMFYKPRIKKSVIELFNNTFFEVSSFYIQEEVGR